MSDPKFDLLLKQVQAGEEGAAAELFQLVYGELYRMARAQMRREASPHTLSPTALVHEAYLRLLGSESEWRSRAYFFGAAAEAMRRVLIDHARKRLCEKRGAGAQRVTWSNVPVQLHDAPDIDLLLLDEALDALQAFDERLALVVKLRYFVDLNVDETACVLGVSPATIKRDWTYARAWLFERMST